MVPRQTNTIFLCILVLFSSLLPVLSQSDPQFSVTEFSNLPDRLFFFEDTPNVIYHDPFEGNVYVSADEGKSWDRANDIPKGVAAVVINHPFNNRYAFILTRGKTHFRTEDRGKTWRSFDLPIAPAFVSNPLSFHSDPALYGYILYQGTVCERTTGWGAICHDETYYTKEAFGDTPELLLSDTSLCQFAHSSKDFKHEAPTNLIYCVGFDSSSSNSGHSLSSSRLFSSTDFFKDNNKIEDLGIGKNARGVIALAIVSKFAVCVMKDLTPGSEGNMLLYVTTDTKSWAKAQFPRASSAKLRENAYTIVESTTHSLAVDVLLQTKGSVGTLFVSNSNGTYFVESLKDTNRNDAGFVDYENIYGVEGVGLANVVANAEDVEGRKAIKQLKTKITFDDGSSWSDIRPPSSDSDGNRIDCDPRNVEECSLHFHSVTDARNYGRIFSSPAPGLVMAVGSIGQFLKPYDQCDTFLSTDAGVTWKMVAKNAHKYEFGDSGSIIVIVNDVEGTDTVRYSTDFGNTWKSMNLGITFRTAALTTVSDSTSQKFVMLVSIARKDQKINPYAIVHLDFAPTRTRQCDAGDFEDWYARTTKRECLMGHKQYYKRRKQNANCYVGHKYEDPIEYEENCPCEEDDYECDYNFIRSGDKCVAAGPEPIPAGVCTGDPNQIYQGSSGYRRIPGNTCVGGVTMDRPVDKKCSQAAPPEGEIVHQTFEFPSSIMQHSYFADSTTILVRLADDTMWQSRNEGYSWEQIQPGERFVVFYLHNFASDRAYLITDTKKFYYTTDTGRNWHVGEAPNPPNTFGAQILHFHPLQSEYLIWTGDAACGGKEESCHAEAHYSTDNGRRWTLIESYVRNCAWARDKELKIDSSQILCESYRDKKGSQRWFGGINPLQLVGGSDFFRKKTKYFDNIVGFTKFSEFLIVAEYKNQQNALNLQVSLDGRQFATGLFPPLLSPENHAYTVLESSTMAVFLHLTTSEAPRPVWGTILKSNSNGTYYGPSIDYVNRNDQGYVDFEKMIGLDGIAVVNVVSNPNTAAVSGRKEIQTRITHNDGGTWKPLAPPVRDSNDQPYECNRVSCALHIHGYTERYDARATYSSPSIVGLLMAVGNVGEKLAPYAESDTFLSRDAGFTWEEVHKDAHLWEFGDSGSILVMANDEVPTDHIMFSTDEGLHWREYSFGETIRIRSIVTVPMDTSRKFILMGEYPRSTQSVVVHVDFTSLTLTRCQLSLDNPGNDDFELWSPSEERVETCLFGRQTLYHRRRRDKNCVVGDQPKAAERIVHNCACTVTDFECEFNYVRNDANECVLVDGATPLPADDSCRNGEEYWYERTAYRKIPFSSCEGGQRIDHGTQHLCPGFKAHSTLFWLTVLLVPFAFTALVAYWFYRRSGMARGTIRLPGDSRTRSLDGSGILETVASIPWFLLGLAGVAWEYISSLNLLPMGFRSRRGYRNVPVDADAQVLRFEDEE